MATRAERREALEALNPEELAVFKWAGHEKDHPDPAKRIAWILRDASKHNYGDDLDELLGLPTDVAQQRNLQREALANATSSKRASWYSGHATWIIAVCAILTVVVSIIALVGLGKSG